MGWKVVMDYSEQLPLIAPPTFCTLVDVADDGLHKTCFLRIQAGHPYMVGFIET